MTSKLNWGDRSQSRRTQFVSTPTQTQLETGGLGFGGKWKGNSNSDSRCNGWSVCSY